jgi:hypothetical protein
MSPVLVILVVGALDMWRRGTSFHWGTFGAGVGAVAGAAALAVAWLVTGGWAEARDPVALLALAVATELALRGWLVERVYRGGGVARRRRPDADDATGPRTSPDDATGPRTSPDDAAGPRPSPDDATGPRPSPDDATGPRTSPDDAAGIPPPPSELRAVLAVLGGALAEALLTPGNLTARIGAAAFGAGLGWMYVRAGLLAPLAARVAFVLGGLALQLPW